VNISLGTLLAYSTASLAVPKELFSFSHYQTHLQNSLLSIKITGLANNAAAGTATVTLSFDIIV
jgi:hypothetical protein